MSNVEKEIEYIGVDISKHTLEVAFSLEGKTQCYENSEEGIQALLSEVQLRENPMLVAEPSGNYEFCLESASDIAGIAFSKVLSSRIRHFAKADGQLAKTDNLDAKNILKYARTFKLERVSIGTAKQAEFKALSKRVLQVKKLKAQEKNHLENTYIEEVRERIQEHIKGLEEEIVHVEERLASILDEEEELAAKKKQLESIKGIGPVISTQCLSQLPELGVLRNKALAALVGVAPYVQESGRYRGQARIYGGRADIRKLLYMGTLSAIKHNPGIKLFYERLKKRGKPAKVAIVACMRKLLMLMNTICREKRDWHKDVGMAR